LSQELNISNDTPISKYFNAIFILLLFLN